MLCGGLQYGWVKRRLDRVFIPARSHPPCIPGTAKVVVANLQAVQLGIDSGELVAQEGRLPSLEQRFVNDFHSFSYRQLLVQTVVTRWRRKDG